MNSWIETHFDTLLFDFHQLVDDIIYDDNYEFKLFCKLAYMYRNLQDNKEWKVKPVFEYTQMNYDYDEEKFYLLSLYEYYEETECISELVYNLWEIQEQNQNECMLYIIPRHVFFDFVYDIMENKYILLPLDEQTFDTFGETGLITEDTSR